MGCRHDYRQPSRGAAAWHRVLAEKPDRHAFCPTYPVTAPGVGLRGTPADSLPKSHLSPLNWVSRRRSGWRSGLGAAHPGGNPPGIDRVRQDMRPMPCDTECERNDEQFRVCVCLRSAPPPVTPLQVAEVWFTTLVQIGRQKD